MSTYTKKDIRMIQINLFLVWVFAFLLISFVGLVGIMTNNVFAQSQYKTLSEEMSEDVTKMEYEYMRSGVAVDAEMAQEFGFSKEAKATFVKIDGSEISFAHR